MLDAHPSQFYIICHSIVCWHNWSCSMVKLSSWGATSLNLTCLLACFFTCRERIVIYFSGWARQLQTPEHSQRIKHPPLHLKYGVPSRCMRRLTSGICPGIRFDSARKAVSTKAVTTISLIKRTREVSTTIDMVTQIWWWHTGCWASVEYMDECLYVWGRARGYVTKGCILLLTQRYCTVNQV